MSDRRLGSEPVSSAQADYDSLRFVSEEGPCPYLPRLLARHEAYQVDHLDAGAYARLLARGFRRSGRILYRPRCRACRECRQIRIDVRRFKPSVSMRRVLRRNADVSVVHGAPQATDEKYHLFRRYLDAQHDGTMARSRECFRDFLYETPTHTLEFLYRVGGRIVGVSIADRCLDGLSSVYMYFDPDFAARSLGTFSVLWEIDYCRREKLAYYYLGFYVAGTHTMSYKARFRPNEILVGDDRWLGLRQ